jgi:DNA-binding SARP family transcriptional activator
LRGRNRCYGQFVLEFRVLGPFEVRRDGRSIDLRGSKRRAVLALLVLQANEVVRTDRLIEDLWGAHRPANAPAALHNHLSRLRKDLGSDVLVTKPWGYVLRADPEAIDLRRFEALVEAARPLPARERSEKLEEALALWRGPAFADLANEPALMAELGRLDELRQSGVEQRIDARLELGEHADVVGELERLIGEHPLRERLRGQLILALYRSGRQAEALETYRETRRVLVEELGIEPSPELRELERAILRQDPALASNAPPSTSAPDEPVPPSSRWRWPRSPLVIVGTALVLIAGVAAAILAPPRSAAPRAKAASPGASTVLVTTAAKPSGSKTMVPPRTKGHEAKSRAEARPPPARPPSGQASNRPRVVPVSSSSRKTTTPSSKHASEPPPPARPPAPPPPPPPPPPEVMSDNFSDGVIDRTLWYEFSDGSGVTVEERGGRLEMAIAAEATGNQGVIQGQYGTQCRFLGDFDVKVDYELLEWPATAGVLVQLTAWFQGNQMSLGRTSIGGEEGYTSTAPPGWSTQHTSYDTRGSLRITRVGQMLRTYYRTGKRWHQLYAFAPSMNARGGTGAPVIGLQVYTRDEWFGRHTVGIAFDNFSIVSKRRACG